MTPEDAVEMQHVLWEVNKEWEIHLQLYLFHPSLQERAGYVAVVFHVADVVPLVSVAFVLLALS